MLTLRRSKLRRLHHQVRSRSSSGSNQQPNLTTASKIPWLLTALESCRDSDQARRAAETGCRTDLRIANALLNTLAKCGSMSDARHLFDNMPQRDIHSWNTLLLGYVKNNQPELAMHVFSTMNLTPDGRTIVAALKACSSLASEEKGVRVHQRAVELGLSRNIFVSNTLIDMFVKCRDVLQAKRVFDDIPRPTVVSWNVLLLGYAENGHEETALNLLHDMLRGKCKPNAWTFTAAAKACARLGEKEEGVVKPESLRRAAAVHSASRGCCDVFLTAALINMYSKCGSMVEARKVFDGAGSHDTATWNSLMLGYAEDGQGEVALEIFNTMVSHRARKLNHLTFYAALTGCMHVADEAPRMENVRRIHVEAVKGGWDRNMLVASTLVNLYARFGSMTEAWKVFDKMERHDLVSRTALMQACVENGEAELGLKMYSVMKQEGLKLDLGCLLAALKACGKLASLEACKVHIDACRLGVEDESFLVTTLLDAYGRSGCTVNCQLLFDSVVKKRGRVVWTVLISAYSRQGESQQVFDNFGTMLQDGCDADAVTLCCMISACASAGLVDRGRRLFSSMNSRFGVAPDLDHYHAMLDLLGKANRLAEAVELVERMPLEASAATWNTLLGACWKWRNVDVARYSFQRCVEVDVRHQFDSSYVLMANIFASRGMWKEQTEVERMRHRGDTVTSMP